MTPYSLSTAHLCTDHLQFIPVSHLDLTEMCPSSPSHHPNSEEPETAFRKGDKKKYLGEEPDAFGLFSHCPSTPKPPPRYSRMILCRCWKTMDHTKLFCLFIGRTSAVCVWERSLISVCSSASCYCQSGCETWQAHGQKCDVEIPRI